jgi:hypothetical protein
MAKNTKKIGISNLKGMVNNWKAMAIVAIVFALVAVYGYTQVNYLVTGIGAVIAIVAAYLAYKNKK